MLIFAIDPGLEYSAIVAVDVAQKLKPVLAIIKPNIVIPILLEMYVRKHEKLLRNEKPRFVIEMIASYGMPVGAEVFETCCWIGQFEQALAKSGEHRTQRVFRRDVKLELCNSSRAKDSNVRAALIDLYGPGKAKAVGLKASPGPLYGFKKDMWAALGVAVTYARKMDAPKDEISVVTVREAMQSA